MGNPFAELVGIVKKTAAETVAEDAPGTLEGYVTSLDPLIIICEGLELGRDDVQLAAGIKLTLGADLLMQRSADGQIYYVICKIGEPEEKPERLPRIELSRQGRSTNIDCYLRDVSDDLVKMVASRRASAALRLYHRILRKRENETSWVHATDRDASTIGKKKKWGLGNRPDGSKSEDPEDYVQTIYPAASIAEGLKITVVTSPIFKAIVRDSGTALQRFIGGGRGKKRPSLAQPIHFRFMMTIGEKVFIGPPSNTAVLVLGKAPKDDEMIHIQSVTVN